MSRKYRKKPIEIEAMQWDGSHESMLAIVSWSGGKVVGFFDDGKYHLLVHTLEGDMMPNPWDYIIKGVVNEFYPCAKAIFEKTYEDAENDGWG